MARRSFDGRKIFNESWDNNTKLSLFWLLSNADGFGLQKESPGKLSDDLQISRRAASDCIERLIKNSVLLRYSDNGSSYLCFRRWQDYQQMRYTGRPSCPFPPLDIYEKLSEKTQKYLCENSENFYTNLHSNSNSNSNSSSKQPPGGESGDGCAFCRKPTKGPLQHYHDRAKAVLGRCVVINAKACAALCSEREGAVGQEMAHKAFEIFLVRDDEFTCGHDLQVFFGSKTFNKCVESVGKSGSTTRKYADPASLTIEQVLEQLHVWNQDGLSPAEWDSYLAMARKAGLKPGESPGKMLIELRAKTSGKMEADK
jgi:hypothetical protein